jgi:hypothetical protein
MDVDAALPIAGGLLMAAVSMVLLVVIIHMVIQARTRREAQRLEFQTRLLERVGSAREFGEFLSTEPGHRFSRRRCPSQRVRSRRRSVWRGAASRSCCRAPGRGSATCSRRGA